MSEVRGANWKKIISGENNAVSKKIVHHFFIHEPRLPGAL
jgi:hypothetical protein